MKVLVIEDSERLRRSLGHGLKRANFAVDLAADGVEGLGYLRAYEYDVVVLDLMLPGISGLDVLETIRKPIRLMCLSLRQGSGRGQDLRVGDGRG